MNYPYVLKDNPSTFVVQFGGGISTQTALNAGSRSVTVAESTPAVLQAFRDPALSDVTGNVLSDPRVSVTAFENRAEAYDRFRKLWADSPDFVASVGPESLPEAFRVRLASAQRYDAFRADYEATAGVQDVIGRVCPPGAPIGGVQ